MWLSLDIQAGLEQRGQRQCPEAVRIAEGLQEIEKKGYGPTFPRTIVSGLQACRASLAGTASGICVPLSAHLVSPAPGSQVKQR